MTEPFVGEIRPWAFDWAPQDWLLCQGQSLPVQQYIALYSLIGNTYGGTPNVNFNLPDLRGRTILGQGYLTFNGAVLNPAPYVAGQNGGAEAVTLTNATMPVHNHPLMAVAANGNNAAGAGNYFAQPVKSPTDSTTRNLYGNAGAMVALSPETIGSAGGTDSHNNMQPFQVLNFCICAVGIFPPRP